MNTKPDSLVKKMTVMLRLAMGEEVTFDEAESDTEDMKTVEPMLCDDVDVDNGKDLGGGNDPCEVMLGTGLVEENTNIGNCPESSIEVQKDISEERNNENEKMNDLVVGQKEGTDESLEKEGRATVLEGEESLGIPLEKPAGETVGKDEGTTEVGSSIEKTVQVLTTEAVPSLEKLGEVSTTEAVPSLEKPEAQPSVNKSVEVPDTEAVPSLEKLEEVLTTGAVPMTEALSRLEKPEAQPSVNKSVDVPDTEALSSLEKPEEVLTTEAVPMTEALSSLEKPEAQPSVNKSVEVPDTEALSSLEKPEEVLTTEAVPMTEALSSLEKPKEVPGTEAQPSLDKSEVIATDAVTSHQNAVELAATEESVLNITASAEEPILGGTVEPPLVTQGPNMESAVESLPTEHIPDCLVTQEADSSREPSLECFNKESQKKTNELNVNDTDDVVLSSEATSQQIHDTEEPQPALQAETIDGSNSLKDKIKNSEENESPDTTSDVNKEGAARRERRTVSEALWTSDEEDLDGNQEAVTESVSRDENISLALPCDGEKLQKASLNCQSRSDKEEASGTCTENIFQAQGKSSSTSSLGDLIDSSFEVAPLTNQVREDVALDGANISEDVEKSPILLHNANISQDPRKCPSVINVASISQEDNRASPSLLDCVNKDTATVVAASSLEAMEVDLIESTAAGDVDVVENRNSDNIEKMHIDLSSKVSEKQNDLADYSGVEEQRKDESSERKEGDSKLGKNVKESNGCSSLEGTCKVKTKDQDGDTKEIENRENENLEKDEEMTVDLIIEIDLSQDEGKENEFEGCLSTHDKTEDTAMQTQSQDNEERLLTVVNEEKQVELTQEKDSQATDANSMLSQALELKRMVLLSSDSSSETEESEVTSSDEGSSLSDSENANKTKDTKKEKLVEESENRDEKPQKKQSNTSTPKNDSDLKGENKKTNEIDAEEKEINKLTNLKTLEAKLNEKQMAGSDDNDGVTSDQDIQEPETSTKESKKQKKRKTADKEQSILDFIRQTNEELCKSSDTDDSESEPEMGRKDTRSSDKNFLAMNGLMLKQMLLQSSEEDSEDNDNDSSTNSSVSEAEKKEVTPVKKNKRQTSSHPSTSRPSWLNDKLLRSEDDSNLSSSEEEARWKRKREKEEKSQSLVVPDESSNSPTTESEESESSQEVFEVKKRKPKVVKVTLDESSKSEVVSSSGDSGTDVEYIASQKSEDTPSKGRRNIKKILKKEALHLETKQALKMENDRKKRLAERQKIQDELYPIADTPEQKTKRLVLDFDPDTKRALVTVHRKLVRKLKPHQLLGVRFMWDNCFESLDRLEEDSGSGCILAHCMGLGKTLQVVTLVHTVLTHNTGVKTTLVVCPLNTVSNWHYEFNLWLRNVGSKVLLYDMIKYKKTYERARQLDSWRAKGGVLIISYELFRNLINSKTKSMKDRDRDTIEKCLLNPGPDLVICDEGHLLKNEDTALSRCMSRIKTLRRVVLTGTPLQNNLMEYHCMVQFIKPNILGNRREFTNRFVNPIQNGQFEDSTEADVRLMKRRSHVLHNMLDGCIQRFDYSVLTPYLPEKHEYVVSIALTDAQARAYKHYLQTNLGVASGTTRSAKLFSDYQILLRIWTHPLTLLAHKEKSGTAVVEEKVEDDELDGNKSDDSVVVLYQPEKPPKIQPQPQGDWWKTFFKESDYHDLRASGKLVLLFSILKECRAVQDKVLVFSQSLYALNLIEHFLCKINEAKEKKEELGENADTWELGRDYFRLDGSTSSEQRSLWCRIFNKTGNHRARLFLISTKAGGLGINLVSANRVIVFSASWNPSHDVQSIFRVFRFGQTKPCFIYRFLAEATMEEKIYERQVTKLSLARRVVDEHQIERHYTMRTLEKLYTFEQAPRESWKTPIIPKDTVLASVLRRHEDIVVAYHEHDSLLENKEEEELTEEERKAAWDDFETERTQVPPTPILPNPVPTTAPQPPLNILPPLAPSLIGVKFSDQSDVRMTVERYKNPVLNQGKVGTFEPRRTHQLPLAPRKPVVPPFATVNQQANRNIPDATKKPTQLLEMGRKHGLVPFEGETMANFFGRVHRAELRSLKK